MHQLYEKNLSAIVYDTQDCLPEYLEELLISLRKMSITPLITNPGDIIDVLVKYNQDIPMLLFTSPTIRYNHPFNMLSFMVRESVDVLVDDSGELIAFRPVAMKVDGSFLTCHDNAKIVAIAGQRFDLRYNKKDLAFTGERVVPTNPAAKNSYIQHMAIHALCLEKLGAQLGRVLDLACGCGYGSYEVSKHANLVIGVDISKEAIDYAASNYSNDKLVFVRSDATKLPFPDDHFDTVTSIETFEHVDPVADYVKEVHRVLVPGGKFCFSTPNGETWEYHPDFGETTGFHVRHYVPEEIRQLLVNFRNIEIEPIDYNEEINKHNQLLVLAHK